MSRTDNASNRDSKFIAQQKKRRRRKKGWSGKKKLGVTLLVVLGILFTFVGGCYAYVKLTLGQVDRFHLSGNNEDLGISDEIAQRYKNVDVINIAMFGVDTRNDDDSGRSDVLMILSLDKVHNKIKLTSIARDTYVPIDGYGKTKINHAYMYGGPELAIKTLNQNFDLNISDFVTVNFGQVAEIIDYVGGVTVNVTEEERQVSNKHFVPELNRIGIPTDPIEGTGDVHLTGGQAVAYARNRYVGTDIARTGRQREVLNALFEEVKTMDATKYPGLINIVLSNCTTSLTDGEMMNIGLWALASGAQISEAVFPNAECNAKGDTIDGNWVFVYDISNAAEILHRFIYDDIQPKDTK